MDGKIGDPSQLLGDSSLQVTPTRSTDTGSHGNADTPTQQYTTPTTHVNGTGVSNRYLSDDAFRGSTGSIC